MVRKVIWSWSRFKAIWQNKLAKYLAYAVGEILLIVTGILLALYVQNWNETRKQEVQFKVGLEQIYNVLYAHLNTFGGQKGMMRWQINLLDSLLYYPDQLNDRQLFNGLYWMRSDYRDYASDLEFHFKNLRYNPKDPDQSKISNYISQYIAELKSIDQGDIDKEFIELKHKYSVPSARLNSDDMSSSWSSLDNLNYTSSGIERIRFMLQSEEFNSVGNDYRTNVAFKYLTTNTCESMAKSLLRMIERYDPKVQLIFQDVGIIGTSINGYDDVGAVSTPMVEVDPENNIWELELYLKVGTVKFRCMDSWGQNWGGNTFPNGAAESFGGDIPVSEPGLYKVRINLSAMHYSFEKLSDANPDFGDDSRMF